MGFVWIAVWIDVFFTFLCGLNLAHSIENQSVGWTIWNFILLVFWMRLFMKDTEKLKNR